MDYERKTEGDLRVDDHVCALVGGQPNPRGPSVAAIRDLLKVVAHELGELVLPCPHDDELQEIVFVPVSGVVVEDLGPIGVEPLRRKRVLETDAP